MANVTLNLLILKIFEKKQQKKNKTENSKIYF